MSGLFGRCVKTIGLFLLVIIFTSFSSDETVRKKKVLIIHSYHQGLIWTDDITNGINSVLNDKDDVEVHIDYLDSKRNTDTLYYRELFELYKHKYMNSAYDAILVSDNNALYFIKDNRDVIFKDIPIVFCAIDQFNSSMISGLKKITGVTEDTDFKKTVEMMVKLHPEARNVVVINDNVTVSAKLNKRYIINFWKDLDTDIGYSFLENLTISQLLEEINKLDKSNIILLTNFSRDKDGNYISYQENIKLIKQVTNLPIYSGWDFYIGKGIVGGLLTSGYDQGRLAAESMVKILEGTDADSIPIIHSGYNHWKFDYSQMVKYIPNLNKIPKGSIIINKPPNFYDKHRNLLIVILCLVVLFSLLLIENEVRNKRKAQELRETNKELDRRVEDKTKALKDANEVLENQKKRIVIQNEELEKHKANLLDLVSERTVDLEKANEELRDGRKRLLMMLDVSSDGAWEYDYSEETFKLSNRTWVRLGYNEEDILDSAAFVDSLLHPNDRSKIVDSRAKYVSGRMGVFSEEYRIRGKNGNWLWFLSRGKIFEYDSKGTPRLVIGTHTDITDRKIAEEKLKKESKRLKASEKRWRSLFQQAQDEILVLDSVGNIVDANIAACKWLGYSSEELKSMNITDLDDENTLDEFMDKFLDKLDNANTEISYDTVQVRKDGSTFPVAVSLNYVEYDDSKMILVLVSDLSRRKETEREVLNAIISTEENERHRFARDLHDTIGPLLSSIRLYLSTLFKTQSQERKEELIKLSDEAINEAVLSVRQITNNLSPQTLTDYGIVSALNSFIQKINASSHIKIDFLVNGFEYRVPKEVELALYRIATELINNSIKHSGGSNIYIMLDDSQGDVDMIYKDDGKGIIKDNSVELSKGMGLKNINIRLKSLNGVFTINTEPDWGFVANIYIPLKLQSWKNEA